jgi:hypothetical protein
VITLRNLYRTSNVPFLLSAIRTGWLIVLTALILPREATGLVLGTVPLLIIAGTIEAPTGLAVPLNFAMSAALLILLMAYLFGAGPENQRQVDDVTAA